MSTEMQNTPLEPHASRRGLVPGVILILVGLLILAGNLFQNAWFALWLLPALAVIFLAWGLLARLHGLIIPGGILLGIGGGALLIEGPLAGLSEPARGGAFLLAFALGWALITVLDLYVCRRLVWWPLIPSGVLGLVGAALFAGAPGLKLLELLGNAWPVILILVGVYLLFSRRGQPAQ